MQHSEICASRERIIQSLRGMSRHSNRRAELIRRMANVTTSLLITEGEALALLSKEEKKRSLNSEATAYLAKAHSEKQRGYEREIQQLAAKIIEQARERAVSKIIGERNGDS